MTWLTARHNGPDSWPSSERDAETAANSRSVASTISKISAGRLVDVGAGASGNLTLSGNLSCTVACGTGAGNHGLRVTGRTGGTLTFEPVPIRICRALMRRPLLSARV